MKELLIIAVGAAVVNNVVLSQFLGLCPFFGVSKKIETAAGMGFTGNQFDLSVSSDSAEYGVYADHSIYFGYCSSGTVCGNVFEEVHAGSV